MPGPQPLTVRTTLHLRLVTGGDSGLLVPAELSYDAVEPYAVTAVFSTVDGDVTWMFARDIVRDGLVGIAGEGDVVVWPSRSANGPTVTISLSSPNGQALLEADLGDVAGFLASTYAVVPDGDECSHVDIDALVADLLDSDN